MALDFDDVGLMGDDMFAFDALNDDVLLGEGVFADLDDAVGGRSRSHSLADSARLLRSASFAASVGSESHLGALAQGESLVAQQHNGVQHLQQSLQQQPSAQTPPQKKGSSKTKTPASQDEEMLGTTVVGGRKKRVSSNGKGSSATGKGKKSAKKATTNPKKHKVSLRLRFALGGQVVSRAMATVQSDALILTTLSPTQQTKATSVRKGRATTPADQKNNAKTTQGKQSNRKKLNGATTPPVQSQVLSPPSFAAGSRVKKVKEVHQPREHVADGPLVRSHEDGATTELLWKWVNEHRWQDANPQRLYDCVAEPSNDNDHILGSPLLSSLLVADDDRDASDDSDDDDDDLDELDDLDDADYGTMGHDDPMVVDIPAAVAAYAHYDNGALPPPPHSNNNNGSLNGSSLSAKKGTPPQGGKSPASRQRLPGQPNVHHVPQNSRGRAQLNGKSSPPGSRYGLPFSPQQHFAQRPGYDNGAHSRTPQQQRSSSLTRQLVAALLPPADVVTARRPETTRVEEPRLEPHPFAIAPPTSSSTEHDEVYERCLADACADAGLVTKAEDVLEAWRSKRRDSALYVKARRLAAKLRRRQRRNALLALPLAADVLLDKRRADATRRNHAALEARWKRLLKKQADQAKRKKAEAKAHRKSNSHLPW